ncbi:hypothetical protein RC86_03865 [Pectobacterium brasiliense]|nr:hypothetical protein B5S52_08110 [Pectobacterium brasiliense]ATV42050.1 hypothetical protein CTV95_00625 [Pectobacterium brasiliense]KFF67976.1 hypothetical protein IW00_08755 [Pectobacterium brasiliense]KHS73775.1 hypothetical protein QT13_04000 [Pectobacterium brasiliense]KHS79710.1 hypothetical protein RC81_09900 [Pectobacterium brasiliense]
MPSIEQSFSGNHPHQHHDLPPQNKTRYHRGGYSLLHLLIFIFAEFFQREFLCLFSTSHAIPSQTS